MKNYKLRVLPLFERDLNEIIDYLIFQLNNYSAAIKLVNDVNNAILERLPFAESFEAYPSKKNRQLNYYRIYVRNYTIFYVVYNGIMEVRRIIYSKRNWKNTDIIEEF